MSWSSLPLRKLKSSRSCIGYSQVWRTSLLRRHFSLGNKSLYITRIPHFYKDKEFYSVTIAKKAQDVHEWLDRNGLVLDDVTQSNDDESSFKYVGFDIEWKPSLRGEPCSRTALLQIATMTSALLVQLKYFSPVSPLSLAKACGFGEEICGKMIETNSSKQYPTTEELPQSLIRVLGSSRIVKVGVGVLEDLVKMQRDFGTPIGSYQDVGLTAKRVLKLEKFGLAALTQYLFGKELYKPKKVSWSNWEKTFLSYQQIRYAAQDAVASRHAFEGLHTKGVFSEKENSFAESNILALLKRGNRQGFRHAIIAAGESSNLFSFLHHYVSSKEDINCLLDAVSGSSVQALKTYCNRANSTVEVLIASHSPFQAAVVINGESVRSYTANCPLLRREKRKLLNEMCREILEDLLSLQRNCIENESYALLQIFSDKNVYMLPHHQLRGHIRGNSNLLTTKKMEIDEKDEYFIPCSAYPIKGPPSYITSYCSKKSMINRRIPI